MPKILKTPGYGKTPWAGTKRPGVRMRVYKPNGSLDKVYQDFNHMERWRQYYKDQGLRTRRI